MHETLNPLFVMCQKRRLHPLPILTRPFQLPPELFQLFIEVSAALLCDIIIKHLAIIMPAIQLFFTVVDCLKVPNNIQFEVI